MRALQGDSFEGRVAVVTGGGSGIGRACAELLAQRGAAVVVADIRGEAAAAVARAIGGHPIQLDVAAPDAVEEAAARVARDLGPAGLLLNAAGIIQGDAMPPGELSFEVYDRVFAVNLRGTHAGCVAFGRRMAERGRGAIVNIASIAGIRSTPLHAYGPMKAAIIRMTENLAGEWGPAGIRVNCVSPGSVLTPALQAAVDRGQRDLGRIRAAAATGRVVSPADVAEAAAFLLSDRAAAITGVNLPVDHGWLVANSWASFGGLRPATACPVAAPSR